MKKLLILTMGLILYMGVFAQETKVPVKKNNFLSISAGPTMPLDNFASNDIVNNEKAGLAKTGFTMNLQYTHTWNKLGIVSQLFYNQYGIDDIAIDDHTISPDHWKLFGLMAGPTFMTPISKNQKFIIDFRAMLGPVTVNSPQFTFQGAPVISQQTNTTFGFALGAGAKYLFAEKFYGQFGLDYMDMTPEFNISSDGVTTPSGEKYSQHITAMNFHFGIGYNF